MAKRKVADERQFALVYLVERLYKGDYSNVVKCFGMKEYQIKDYINKFYDEVMAQIGEENKDLALTDVPDITTIKKMTLSKIWETIVNEKDPSKLAMVYARLSDYEKTDSTAKASIAESVLGGLAKNKK